MRALLCSLAFREYRLPLEMQVFPSETEYEKIKWQKCSSRRRRNWTHSLQSYTRFLEYPRERTCAKGVKVVNVLSWKDHCLPAWWGWGGDGNIGNIARDTWDMSHIIKVVHSHDKMLKWWVESCDTFLDIFNGELKVSINIGRCRYTFRVFLKKSSWNEK